MSDSRFSAPANRAVGGHDPYGYFATPSAPAGSASPFGGPPVAAGAGPGPSTFAAGPHAAPSPSPYAQPATKSRRGTNPGVKALVVLLVVAGLAYGGWTGWNVHQRSREVVLPTTLGGAPTVHNAASDKVTEALRDQIQTANPGMKLAVGAYMDKQTVYVLAAVRGEYRDLQKDLNTAAMTPVPATNTCAVAKNGSETLCAKTDRNLTVIVVVNGTSAPAASAAVDEAWGEL